jgi:hypothetical protein
MLGAGAETDRTAGVGGHQISTKFAIYFAVRGRAAPKETSIFPKFPFRYKTTPTTLV